MPVIYCNDECCYADCNFDEYHNYCVIMVSFIQLSVIGSYGIMLSIIVLSIVILSIVMLSHIMIVNDASRVVRK